MRKFSFFLMLLLVGATCVLAGQPVEQTLNAAPDGEVSVEIISGELTIVGWANDQVQITGELGDQVEGLDIDTDSDGISIEMEFKDHHNLNEQAYANLEIRVPHGSSLDVECVAVETSITGVHGEISIESVSGNVEISDAGPSVDIESVAGNVTITGGAGDSMVESAAGNVGLNDRSGEIDIEVVTGNLTIMGGVIENADLASVNGKIHVEATLGNDSDMDIESVNGSVVLVLGGNVSASFQVSTFNGNIESDFGEMNIEKEEFIPAKEARFTVGGGDSSVSIETFGGSVQILRN